MPSPSGWAVYSWGIGSVSGSGGIPRKWWSGWGPGSAFYRHSASEGLTLWEQRKAESGMWAY